MMLQNLQLQQIQRSPSKSLAHPSFANAEQFSKLGIQAKANRQGLQIRASNDAFEQEADAVANAVVKMPLSQMSFQSIYSFHQSQNTIQRSAQANSKPILRKENAPSSKNAGETVNPRLEQQLNPTKGSGIGLEAPIAKNLGNAMGADFGNVRIHTHAAAIALNQNLNARAFTHGNDIYFNQGEFNPNSRAGKHLLPDELSHVVQQTGKIQKQDAPGAAPPAPVPAVAGPMTRVEFDRVMSATYGVTTIRTGTEAQQVAHHGMPAGTTLPGWQSWDPGASSDVYQYIIDAFANFNTSFNGFPQVNEITFYKVYYEMVGGVPTPNSDVGADFGTYNLAIYEQTTTARKGVPMARSNAEGEYERAPILRISYGGDANAAPIGYPQQRDSVMRLISHELGHGLAVAAHMPNYNGHAGAAVDPSMMIDYMAAVGWHTHADLYDIGVPAVRAALATNTAPAMQYKITAADWNDPKWVEQPVSEYSITGGASEDFAEAIMVFVENPALLLARSPARHAFILARMATWQPQLSQPRPPAVPGPAPAPNPSP